MILLFNAAMGWLALIFFMPIIFVLSIVSCLLTWAGYWVSHFNRIAFLNPLDLMVKNIQDIGGADDTRGN